MSAASAGTLEAPADAAAVTTDCLHCGQQLGPTMPAPFCCNGCRAVYSLIHSQELDRYYEFRGSAGVPIPNLRAERRDLKWLEAYEDRLEQATGAQRVELDIQGIHCAGCVWLLQELFDRQRTPGRVLVNPAIGSVELLISQEFPLRRWVDEVERFGYLFGPPLKHRTRRSDGLLMRLVICIVLASNAMLFSAALYFGLHEGAVHTFVVWFNYAAAVLSVAIGGPVFFRSAWRAIRRGMLHLDVPISLGILLAFAGSSWTWLTAGDDGAYFDTISVFVALMLLGRWLQQRLLDRNRDRLLASDGVDGLTARRIRHGRVELVGCRELRSGDELLIAPGDLVPVPGTLLDHDASCSLDWINGESTPRAFVAGDKLAAGAFNAGATAIRLSADADFDDSPLVALLRAPLADDNDDGVQSSQFARKISGVYVVAVLAAATVGLLGWLLTTGDVPRSLEVAVAVLIVTCPCAFGIAAPLAHELALAGLRRIGLFVRSASFLDRAQRVRRIVFDKTGTLTSGTLELADPQQLQYMTARERQALYDLASRSNHARSQAVCRALDAFDLALRPEVTVTEVPGRGVQATTDGAHWRLGAPAWVSRETTGASDAGSCAVTAGLAFGTAARRIALFHTLEPPRPDAAREVARLTEAGHELWILSGDSTDRVHATARDLGVPEQRAIGDQSPESKAQWLAAHDRGDTLFLGDGINDSLVAAQATCSGTPAIDRPFMAARTDFYFVTPGLAPIGTALRTALTLGRVLRRNFTFAVAYNVVAVALAWAGLMRPWLAAVLMPLSSIAIVLATVAALSPRSTTWRS